MILKFVFRIEFVFAMLITAAGHGDRLIVKALLHDKTLQVNDQVSEFENSNFKFFL